MTQSEIDVKDEIAAQTISDPYVKRRFLSEILKKRPGKELNMVLRDHIFLLLK
ncbi:hypothetical protein Dpo_18c00330 [Desulfotignum phosphitoxidans DSM 13687]|jgi:hypothetical protein|uniref:Uncharacterized protein n=1 Tax=Desulfotignum phosphitoxidans DSM 13687 TaxID=1286635 RepID=S0FRH5_9BACT|nr:hypothetical protein Dpo_18c00330 [Desulfotignum phosphitoxidans DSM 13687]